jgi:hypothetical protein
MKLLTLVLLIVVVFLTTGCPKDKKPPIPTANPTPIPTPTPTPTSSPTPSPTVNIPISWATPYPTPSLLSIKIPTIPAVTISLTQEGNEDYAEKIQRVMDSPLSLTTLISIGPGKLTRPIIVRNNILLDLPKGTHLACDITEPLQEFEIRGIPLTDYGCLLLADGVTVFQKRDMRKELVDFFEKGNASKWRTDPYFQALTALTDQELIGESGTILEPTYYYGDGVNKTPQVATIMTLNDVLGSHQNISRDIAVIGVAIEGRQEYYDGGVRSTVQLGNCHNCLIYNSLLFETASIGFSAGGSALDKGNYSNNVLFYRNITIGVAAANTAFVNSENSYVINHYARRPGSRRFAAKNQGGGVTAFDLETNIPDDHSKEIYVLNSLADYEGSPFPGGAGSAFVAQDPYNGANHGLVVIANNAAIGGRDDRLYRFMSNGIYLNGLKGCQVINNYVYRTGQNAIQAYRIKDCLIQDNDFEHTGGGGAVTISLQDNSTNNIIRRSHYRSAPVAISSSAGFEEIDNSCGNKYEGNLIDGLEYKLISATCKQLAPVKKKN